VRLPIEFKFIQFLWRRFIKKTTLDIRLPIIYAENSNSNIFHINKYLMSDIKLGVTQKLLSDPKLLERANKGKLITTTFSKIAPTGTVVTITHDFHWNGSELFSLTQEVDALRRDIKINSILNK
jgi:hypothetical protein